MAKKTYIKRNTTTLDVMREYKKGNLTNLEKNDIGASLYRYYLKVEDLSKAESDIKDVMADISGKIALARANLGIVISKGDKDKCLAQKGDVLKFAETYNETGKQTGYKLMNGTVEKYNIKTNDVAQIGKLVLNVANIYGLEKGKVKRIESLIEALPMKVGSERAKIESELSSVLNLSSNGRGLQGIVVSASEVSKRAETGKLRERIKTQGLRLQGYRLRLSAIRCVRSVQNGHKSKSAEREFQKTFGLSKDQIESIFE